MLLVESSGFVVSDELLVGSSGFVVFDELLVRSSGFVFVGSCEGNTVSGSRVPSPNSPVQHVLQQTINLPYSAPCGEHVKKKNQAVLHYQYHRVLDIGDPNLA